MKKNIYIFITALIMLSFISFIVMRKNNIKINNYDVTEEKTVAINTTADDKISNRIFTDFIYDVGPRFGSIKKADLDAMSSFNDIIGEEHAERIIDYKSVSVIVIVNDEKSEIHETGYSDQFNDAQLALLKSSKYSTNLLFSADLKEKNAETGVLEDTRWTPYLTIVPEKQAEYSEGKEALMKYLKENSEDARAHVIPEKLQPAKLYFTVTKNGTIAHVRLDRSSNYLVVDKRMIDLITNLPGKWEPAENLKGEKVDQELVISFGLMGC